MKRTDYIGGADSAALLGRHMYRSRRAVWLAKRGETADLDLSGNPHVVRGEFLEPYVEKYIRDNIDPTINNEDAWQKHDALIRAERRIPQRDPGAQIMLLNREPHPATGKPYIGGHPDGVGEEVLWEIKCPTSYKLARITREGLPAEWTFQVQHYMMLTGLLTGCVVVWDSDAWLPHLFWIDADLELHEIMRDEYRAFWQHVADGTEPTDGTRAQDHQVLVVTDEATEELLRTYKQVYNARYEGEREQKIVKAQILTAAQGRNCLITPSFTATIQRTKNRFGTESTRLTVSENAAMADDTED